MSGDVSCQGRPGARFTGVNQTPLSRFLSDLLVWESQFFSNFPEILIVINCVVRKFKLAIPVAAKSQPCLDGNGDLGQARLLRRICGQFVNTCEIFQGEKNESTFLNYEK